ncbi:APC family permease [Flexivirga meconopsidis]|uniref:APC family permease n=1 Tax=Flexivirga meconopsidis TaxID=2977121 RepID=UPI00224055BE|nr:APC family permease [Flexivirga meconopsidis]
MSQGTFKPKLSTTDMVMVGFGAIFGSGWLFAASKVAGMAGPAGWLSWLIGGIAVLLLGLVYSELGASLPRAGGVIRYPLYSHGPLLGYLMGFVTLIAFSSLIAIEVEAARQYASAWFPALTQGDSSSPTVLGWLVQFALILLFFVLNYLAVQTFAKSNSIITVFKFVVPVLTIVVLLFHVKGANFSSQGFAPFGMSGVQAAVAGGGVMFAFLGLQPIVTMASEAKKPQRTVPIALILSVVLATGVYILLQVAFIGAVPSDLISGGWQGIDGKFSLPFKDIATVLGLGWLGVFIVLDAMISPSGTGNIYVSSTSRVVYGWARNGTLFKVFTRVDPRSGVPRPAMWLTFALAVFWTLPFPSWGVLVNVVSAALILSYAIAPVCAGAFRRRLPDMPKPFRLKGFAVISPLAFVIASYIVYWTGWSTISWLLGSQLVMFGLYLLARNHVPTHVVGLAQQLRSSWWLVAYYVAMLVVSFLGSYGGRGVLDSPWDLVVITTIGLGAYFWGTASALPDVQLDEDPVEAGDGDEKSPDIAYSV